MEKMHPQMKETVRLMKTKVAKEHRCEPGDLIFNQPSFGEDVGHGRRTAKMRYLYHRRLKGTVAYDGKTITVSH